MIRRERRRILQGNYLASGRPPPVHKAMLKEDDGADEVLEKEASLYFIAPLSDSGYGIIPVRKHK